MLICAKCKVNPVEQIDEWVSNYCSFCNDRMIERSNKRREWDHFHPGQPCPKSELES